LAFVLTFSQSAWAGNLAIENGLNAAGCDPFMKRLAVPANMTLESSFYGKELGSWTTEDFQYLLNFGTRCFRAQLSESMASNESEVLRGQINDRINSIAQIRRHEQAQREAERQMSTVKADNYAMEPEEAAFQAHTVEQDGERIAQIENEFRERYRVEVDNPNTSAHRLNEILTELNQVKQTLAHSPRLTTFSDHIRFQISSAQDRNRNRPPSQEELELIGLGGFYARCQIFGVQHNNTDIIQAAVAKMQEVSDKLIEGSQGTTANYWMNAFSGNAARGYPQDRAGLQKLYKDCQEHLNL